MLQEFVDAVQKCVRKELQDVHTAIPGKIVSFDTKTGLATVLPTMKFKKPDGTMMDYPQITGVPVLFQQGYGQNATIAFPVKAGDGCLIIVSEQSIDYWMYGQETETDLAFDLTDAICIPGLFVKANPVVKEACENNAVILDVSGTRVRVEKNNVEITSTNVKINGSLTVTGSVSAYGNVYAAGVSANSDVTAGGISLTGHTHSGDGVAPS